MLNHADTPVMAVRVRLRLYLAHVLASFMGGCGQDRRRIYCRRTVVPPWVLGAASKGSGVNG